MKYTFGSLVSQIQNFEYKSSNSIKMFRNISSCIPLKKKLKLFNCIKKANQLWQPSENIFCSSMLGRHRQSIQLNTLYGNLEAKAPFSISTKQDQGDREQVVLQKTFKLSRFRWNRNPKRVTENVLRWSILSPLLS